MDKERENSNVVYLTQLENGRGGGIPYYVERLRREMESFLVSALRNALMNAQEYFAEASEGQEESPQVLMAYRESELSFRLHRHDMEEILRAGLGFRFRALIDPLLTEPPFTPPASALERAFVERLSEPLREPAHRSTLLLGRLFPHGRQGKLSSRNSPLAPEHIADLFLRVERVAQIEQAHRRIVLDILAAELEGRLAIFYRKAQAILAGDYDNSAEDGAPGADFGSAPEGLADAQAQRLGAPGDESVGTPNSLSGSTCDSASQRLPTGDSVTRAVSSRHKVEQGRQRVEREIERCLAGRGVPTMVERMIRDHWARLLLLVHVAEGPESDEWVHFCAIMERLVWSFQPPPDDHARRRLVHEIPLLLHELTDGLHLVVQDPFEITSLLRALELEYLGYLTAGDPELERLCAHDEPLDRRSAKDDLANLARLPEGTWMELNHTHSEPFRVRMAGSDGSGRLIFVNRAGFKVLERTPAELAAAISRGDAQMLDDEKLLDAGLSRVMRLLSDRRLGHGD